MVSTRLGTQNHFWPASVLWDYDVPFCLRSDPNFCHPLRLCTYRNSFFPKYFFITFIHIPCPALGEVPCQLCAMLTSCSIYSLECTAISSYFQPAFSAIFSHSWRPFCWWAEYPLHAKFPFSFSESSLISPNSLGNIERWYLSGTWIDRISWEEGWEISLSLVTG